MVLAVGIDFILVLGNETCKQRGAHGLVHSQLLDLVQGIDRSLVRGVHRNIAVCIGAEGLGDIRHLVFHVDQLGQTGLGGLELGPEFLQHGLQLFQIRIELRRIDCRVNGRKIPSFLFHIILRNQISRLYSSIFVISVLLVIPSSLAALVRLPSQRLRAFSMTCLSTSLRDIPSS